MSQSTESLKAAILNPKTHELPDRFMRVISLVKVLRRECPWDRKQTRESLGHLLLEEAYELIHAIDEGNEQELKKELGDLFLHICFQVVLAEEANSFTFEGVFNALCEKLINRHPHVFGKTVVENETEVLKNWETLKMKEGRENLLDGVPKAMSELLRAYRVQKKVAGVGFDWKSGDEVLEKLAEEIGELKAAATPEEREDEFGDLLFTIVNYSRFIGVNPEDSLRKATGKFMARFATMEREVQASGRPWQEYDMEELDLLWNKAKNANR
ncbi:MAG: nucleoside triphosphate pyrophosphohydrolase [Chlorobi bacterium]|nr:nucleoside triphosphate pyrophosphohydrolase [Chlorobiota bacterium]